MCGQCAAQAGGERGGDALGPGQLRPRLQLGQLDPHVVAVYLVPAHEQQVQRAEAGAVDAVDPVVQTAQARPEGVGLLQALFGARVREAVARHVGHAGHGVDPGHIEAVALAAQQIVDCLGRCRLGHGHIKAPGGGRKAGYGHLDRGDDLGRRRDLEGRRRVACVGDDEYADTPGVILATQKLQHRSEL
ncbi:hypothetical protein D9M69_533160 [compost metagenome]